MYVHIESTTNAISLTSSNREQFRQLHHSTLRAHRKKYRQITWLIWAVLYFKVKLYVKRIFEIMRIFYILHLYIEYFDNK